MQDELQEKPLMNVKTVAVEYGRKFNLGDYNSADVSVTVWADVREDADLGQAITGLRELARNHVIVEASRFLKTVRARSEHLYLGKPVVNSINDVEAGGERFISGDGIAPEICDLLTEFGIDPKNVIIRQTAEQVED